MVHAGSGGEQDRDGHGESRGKAGFAHRQPAQQQGEEQRRLGRQAGGSVMTTPQRYADAGYL